MRVHGEQYRTVWLTGSTVHLIDQRKLPARFEILALPTYHDTAEAIRNMHDVAEAVSFFVSPRSAKTTGCILTVDGGLREAFPR